jgi:NADPH:quinone reductase-like Zn-dependent oxidoreductase
MLVGKRVACLSKPDGDGAWAEYMIADEDSVIEIDWETKLKEACCSLIYPLTVI